MPLLLNQHEEEGKEKKKIIERVHIMKMGGLPVVKPQLLHNGPRVRHKKKKKHKQSVYVCVCVD